MSIMAKRKTKRQEVKQVLKSGHHEKNKDQFDEEFLDWNYSIKGKTIDKRNLRVIISFEKSMLIITVIDLDK